jgi:hypothetical protein
VPDRLILLNAVLTLASGELKTTSSKAKPKSIRTDGDVPIEHARHHACSPVRPIGVSRRKLVTQPTSVIAQAIVRTMLVALSWAIS